MVLRLQTRGVSQSLSISLSYSALPLFSSSPWVLASASTAGDSNAPMPTPIPTALVAPFYAKAQVFYSSTIMKKRCHSTVIPSRFLIWYPYFPKAFCFDAFHPESQISVLISIPAQPLIRNTTNMQPTNFNFLCLIWTNHLLSQSRAE